MTKYAIQLPNGEYISYLSGESLTEDDKDVFNVKSSSQPDSDFALSWDFASVAIYVMERYHLKGTVVQVER